MSRPQRSAGIPWGPFRLRIPFIHTRFMASEFFQGLSISAATALALVPLLTGPFGLTFGEAVVMSIIHSFLISCAWMVFGEPYSPGWVTPALPFVITFVVSDSFVTPAEKFQAMTALSLDLALILVVLGMMTSLSKATPSSELQPLSPIATIQIVKKNLKNFILLTLT